MGKIENDELRKIRNAHFIRAFEHVKHALNMTQGKLAKAIGSESAYISNYRNGTRPVPGETIEALIHISASKPGLQIFSEYLYGNSDIMLLANVSNEEMDAAQMRRDNPDYDVMEKRRKESEQELDAKSAQHPYIDPSSERNSSISAYVQLTNRLTDDLKRKDREMSDRLAEKDARIVELKSAIADKDARIIELKATIADKEARIIDLQRQLAAAQTGNLSNYPFAIGVAEQREHDSNKF